MRRLAVGLIGLLACADVLDLTEDRVDAIERLCACTDEVPQFDGKCVDLLSVRLGEVSGPTREAWLNYFAEHGGGDGVCPNAYGCYSQPGTCAALGCGEARECCGFVGAGGGGVICHDDGLCESAQ